MKVLVTGFDPFGNDVINPSYESVKRLPSKIANADIIKLEIPTIAQTSLKMLKEAIQKYKPDIVINVGVAKGRGDISVERVGINVDNFSICDNAHNQIIEEPIFLDGPDAYFSNLPIQEMVKAMNEANIKASISNSAGTFVCNHVLYGVRYLIEHEFLHVKSGFIHVPCLCEQVGNEENIPSMELFDMVKGLTIAISTCVKEGLKL
ncbi:MAG: pyroglutamyl-peptidase I [Longicatena sp.]